MSQKNQIIQIEHDSTDGSICKIVLEPTSGALVNMCHLEKREQLSANENFSSFRAIGNIPMEGIVYLNSAPEDKEVDKLNLSFEPHYVVETYEEYLQKLEAESANLAWIQKIINGESEIEKILHREDEFLVVRDWKFDVKEDPNNSDGDLLFNRDDLHLLGIPVNPIPSIRDIRQEHIHLLEAIKERALSVCETVYGINRSEIKIYFHYPPSTYHLHIHFTWAGLNDSTTNFERAYDYDSVIKNIRLDPEYYRDDMKYIEFTYTS
jgi:m7GpppX diphosphatase